MASIDIAANMPTLQALVHFDYSDLEPIAELQAKFVFDTDAIVLAQLPTPSAVFRFATGSGVVIAATLPKLVADFVTAEGIVVAGVLPRLLAAVALSTDISITMAGNITLYASMAMFQENHIAIEASLPRIRAAIGIVNEATTSISGTLPTMTASFSVSVEGSLVVTATLPPLVAALFIDLAEDCTYELRYER